MTVTSGAPDAEAIARLEAWFVAEGVPHFIVDHSPRRIVLRRAAPILVAYLAVTLLMTASFTFSFELNVIAVAGAAAIVVVAWGMVNALRGRHWRSLPDRIGPPEVLTFLLLPAVPPLIVGFQLSDAVIAIIESAAFLAIVYVATSYRLLAALRWAVDRARAQLGSLGRLLTRALPLLLVFIVFVFLQSDTWQVAAAMDWRAVALVLTLFFGLSLAFLIGRIVPDVKRIAEGERSWSETLEIGERTPAAPLRDLVAHAKPTRTPLAWHEWINVGTIIAFGQGVQIVLVTVVVQVVLLVFGLLLVPMSLQAVWIGQQAVTLAVVPIGEPPLTITAELIRVSLILGAFSGLYFTIAALSDATYRAEFFSHADRELEDVFAARAMYLTALELGLGASPTTDGAAVPAAQPVEAQPAEAAGR